MDLLNQLQLTYNSISTVLPALFFVLSSVYLLSISNTNSERRHIGILFFMLSLFPISSFVNYSFLKTNIASTDLIKTIFVLGIQIHLMQFILHYPANNHKRLSLALLFLGWASLISIWIYFLVRIQEYSVYFSFLTNSYHLEKDNKFVYLRYGLYSMIGLNFLLSLWKVYKLKKEQKGNSFVLFLLFLFVSIIPGLMEYLSRISEYREELLNSVGYSIQIVLCSILLSIYAHYSKNKYSASIKITSFSFFIFYLAFTKLTYHQHIDIESHYDQINHRDAKLIFHQLAKNENLRYQGEYFVREDQFLLYPEYQNSGIKLDYTKGEFYNTYILDTILFQDVESAIDLKYRFQTNSQGARYYFHGYRAIINHYLNSQSIDSKNIITKLKSYVLEYDDNLLSLRNKVEKLSELDFRENFQKQISTDNKKLEPFMSAIQTHIATSKSVGITLKNEVQTMLSKICPIGVRHNRKNISNIEEFYHGYMLVDLSRGKVYEAGFSYQAYRIFLHNKYISILYTALGISFGLFFVQQMFLHISILGQLEALSIAMSTVIRGNLNVRVASKGRDQIGHLSKTFNRMIFQIDRKLDFFKDKSLELGDREEELKFIEKSYFRMMHDRDLEYRNFSSLLNSINQNINSSENIQTDMLVSYLKSNEENNTIIVGSDICIIDHIYLKSKPYTVFINAEISGVSLYEVSGGLILGSLFHSIVERTKSNFILQSEYPERWLKNTFLGFHHVFESFHQKLLMSIAIGLIDDQTGFMYYINAEHPFFILHRNRQAEYLDRTSYFRRLGTMNLDGTLWIQTYQLYPGDEIFIGSDKTSSRDQERLHLIEKHDGDLDTIFENIGKSIDTNSTYSLLKIRFIEKVLPKQPEDSVLYSQGQLLKAFKVAKSNGDNEKAFTVLETAHKLYRQNMDIMKNLAFAYLNRNNFQKAAELSEEYIDMNPADSEYIYVASYSYKKIEQFEKAAILGERLRLRIPNMIKNLINLSEIYYLMGNFVRSSLINHLVLEIDPQNKLAQQMSLALSEIYKESNE